MVEIAAINNTEESKEGIVPGLGKQTECRPLVWKASDLSGIDTAPEVDTSNPRETTRSDER